MHAKKHIIAEQQRAKENQIKISEGIPKEAAKNRTHETENHSKPYVLYERQRRKYQK